MPAPATPPSPLRRRLLLLAAVAVAAAVAVTAAVLAGGGGEQAKPATASEVAALYAGIPQDGAALGRPDAPLTLEEYADLQCPFCAQYSNAVMPALLRDYVRSGQVRLVFRNLAFLGPDSVRAAQAAAAAGAQDRLWEFVHVFYAKQGPENSGYATDDFLREIAGEVPGLDAEAMMAGRGTARVQRYLAAAQARANRFGIHSTPSFLVWRRGEAPRPLRVGSLAPGEFAAALDAALAGQ